MGAGNFFGRKQRLIFSITEFILSLAKMSSKKKGHPGVHVASCAYLGGAGPLKQIRITHLFQYTFALHMTIMMAITSPGIAIFLDAEYDGTEWWNLAAKYAYEAIGIIGNAKSATQKNHLKHSFRLEHWYFDHWKIVSDLDIRISCFATWIVPRRFEGEVHWNKGKGL
jgi:hypothetical protein